MNQVTQLLRLFKQRQDTLDARISALETEEMREQVQDADFSQQLDALLIEIEDSLSAPVT
jgi:hypothetical protein